MHVSSAKVSIVITSFNDLRVLKLIPALMHFSPYEIIIADGGSIPSVESQLKALEDSTVKFHSLPGNIAETRFQVQPLIKGDITVFVDTDELPTEGWMQKLIEPVSTGVADFTFGSTVPLHPPDNRFGRYLNDYDQYLYNSVLQNDILKGAMGNSAWRTEIIQNVGFDPCLGIGGEDYDLTIRAINSGYRGKYVQGAVLKHDQNSIRTFRRFTKKIFYNYQVGASLAYRKNNMLFKRIHSSTSANVKFKDPLEILIFLFKFPALIFSLMIDPWHDERYCRKQFTGNK